MAISGSIFLAGCGSEPCPETPPKVRAIHGATSGGLNSELIKALKNVCPPPPLRSLTGESHALCCIKGLVLFSQMFQGSCQVMCQGNS